jgi:hypothetical protein
MNLSREDLLAAEQAALSAIHHRDPGISGSGQSVCLNDVAQRNPDKLSDRQQRDVPRGSGDCR